MVQMEEFEGKKVNVICKTKSATHKKNSGQIHKFNSHATY
jgi:hypothetical protein